MVYIWDYLYTNKYRPGSKPNGPRVTICKHTDILNLWRSQKSSNIGHKNIRDIARASAGEQARARTMNRERKNTLRSETRVPTRVR